jgi:hypothetical protein
MKGKHAGQYYPVCETARPVQLVDLSLEIIDRHGTAIIFQMIKRRKDRTRVSHNDSPVPSSDSSVTERDSTVWPSSLPAQLAAFYDPDTRCAGRVALYNFDQPGSFEPL